MPEELTKGNALVIMGEEDVVSGFRALGFRTYALKELKEFKEALEEVVKNKTGICLVQGNLFIAAAEQIDSYRIQPLPIFIPFSKDRSRGLLENIVKDIRIRATGAL
jgi:vacuolar-type H+-ATPase subunit F/Vma7